MEFEKYFDCLNNEDDNSDVEEDNCCIDRENFEEINGITYCKKCGKVISNILTTPEWRNYNEKGKSNVRCGMPINILLPQSSVGSTISNNNYSKTMNQIRRYQSYTAMPYKERSLYKVFNYITDICKKNNINNKIINDAHSLYSIITKTKISRGKNRDGIIAACVFMSCKECGVPRSSKEIAKIFNIPSTVMTKGCKKFYEIMNLNNKNKDRINVKISINPSDFLERFCDQLELNENDIKKITYICNFIFSNNIISENTPPSIAAGSIFYYIKINNLDINKKELSNICNISEVTINKCYKKILNDENLNNQFRSCKN